jgi:hypothetical protein
MVVRIFSSKREDVTGGWRKLHNEELYHLNSSPRIIWIINSREISVACSKHGRDEKCIQNFSQKMQREKVTWGI